MTPAHHLPEELLVGYAAGTLPEPLSLLVAAHASLCRPCAELADLGAELGGALLEEAEAAKLSGGALERALSRLDRPAPAAEPAPPPGADPSWPAPVCRALGSAPPRWRFLTPRIRYADLPVRAGDRPVRLVRIAPGVGVPRHGHSGTEYTLVLSGGLVEEDRQVFRRGDLLVRDESAVHTLRTEPTETCFSLVVQQGPLRPRTLAGRLIQKLTNY